MSKAEAQARIAQREKDPKHQRDHDPERADRETANDDFDDESKHDRTGKVDSRWKQDAAGNWLHPDFD